MALIGFMCPSSFGEGADQISPAPESPAWRLIQAREAGGVADLLPRPWFCWRTAPVISVAVAYFLLPGPGVVTPCW